MSTEIQCRHKKYPSPQALFWLAQKAERKAIGALHASIENDPSLEVKKKAVFARSQLPKE